MQIVSILSQKGGGGKTTVATNLAVASASASVPTLLLDMDPQQSALTWNEWRQRNPPKTKGALYVRGAGRSNVVERLTEAKAQKVRVVIIDTPPASAAESEIAARSAHLVVVVVQPSMFDLATLRETFSLPSVSGRPALVLLNRVPTTGTTLADARKVITDLGYDLVPCALGDRAIFRNAPMDGLGVMEAERASGSGASEVAALYKWVVRQLDSGPKRVPRPPTDDILDLAGGGS